MNGPMCLADRNDAGCGLRGRTALVTGGARGIGFATARRLVGHGVTTTILDIDGEALESARRELEAAGHAEAAGHGEADARAADGAAGGADAGAPRVFAHRCDVTKPEELRATVERAAAEMGRIDILINNAGTLTGGAFHEQRPEAQRRLIEVNITSVVALTRLVLPRMLQNGRGHVVNVASAASTLGVPDLAVYTATKWAVWGLTESLRHEARNAGHRQIGFSSVHPNYVASGLFEGAGIPGLGGLLVPRIRSHDEVARAVVEKCLRRGRRQVFIPRGVRLAVLLRGLLPYPLFLRVVRTLGVHRSMAGWRGREVGSDAGADQRNS